MRKRATVYDVAQAAGVSIATVSFTFRRPERVRESTREVVLEAARRLEYVPNASARGLAHGRTGVLGLYAFDMFLEADGSRGARRVRVEAADRDDGERRAFADDADAEDFRVYPLYVDEVQRGFQLECARRGRTLLVGRGPGAEGGRMLDIASRVDGLAVFPGTQKPEVLAQLARRLPVVGFAMPDAPGDLHQVRVDNAGGARAVTEHLVREHGITRLEFVGAPEMPDYAERFAGMQAALGDLGLPVPRAVLDPTPLAAADPYPVVRRLAARRAVPPALVCASDQHALEVVQVLRDAGYCVPRDVAVTGFDGVVAGRVASPSLTTVRQPMEALGRAAVEILTESLAVPDAGPLVRTFPLRLLTRESCGCTAPR